LEQVNLARAPDLSVERLKRGRGGESSTRDFLNRFISDAHSVLNYLLIPLDPENGK
jgi:hypothetical protein